MTSFSFAIKNTRKSYRRSLMTAALVALGVAFVTLFFTYAGSFKSQIVDQITSSVLGHIQIHRSGYVESLDNMPLDKNISKAESDKLAQLLLENSKVLATTQRLKFSGLISNYSTSTNIRLNGIDPTSELKTLPGLKDRLSSGTFELLPGDVIVPEVVARGMSLKIGDTVVIVATNEVGSMNAVNLKVKGVLGIISGPGGKDGYVHLNDAQSLLRTPPGVVNEFVLRVDNLDDIKMIAKDLKQKISRSEVANIEIHDWEKLSPFTNISKIIDVLNVSVQIVLISLVLISILNIMIMGVFERIREIGTLSAIGTNPHYIASVFIWEGLIIGLLGLIIGVTFSSLLINLVGEFQISFGQQQNILLSPELKIKDFALVSVLVLFISVIAALYPALKAANMKPADALRG